MGAELPRLQADVAAARKSADDKASTARTLALVGLIAGLAGVAGAAAAVAVARRRA